MKKDFIKSVTDLMFDNIGNNVLMTQLINSFKCHVNMNTADKNNDTLLSRAVCTRAYELQNSEPHETLDLEIISTMIDYGSDASHIDRYDNSPLDYCLFVGSDVECAQLLLDKGVQIRTEMSDIDSDYLPPLLNAIGNHHRKLMEILLRSGAELQFSVSCSEPGLHHGPGEWTPMSIAVSYDSFSAAELLIECGYNVSLEPAFTIKRVQYIYDTNESKYCYLDSKEVRDARFEQFSSLLLTAAKKSPTLKQLSRLKVWKQFADNNILASKLNQLEIPQTLIDYLVHPAANIALDSPHEHP